MNREDEDHAKAHSDGNDGAWRIFGDRGGERAHLDQSGRQANARINDEQVFNDWGCPGKNVSPALNWSGAPKGTKSFAVNVYDPDAPTGSGFWHWYVVNIPAETTSLAKGAGDPKANALPAGTVQAKNDFGAIGYGGPCPPKGAKPHRYQFTIFALDVDKLDVNENASPAVFGFNVLAHTLAKATVTGLWGH